MDSDEVKTVGHKDDLPVELVRELFNYDPATGVLSWRKDAGRWGRIKAGTAAGSACTTGHLQIGVNGRSCMAHRIAFTHHNGRTPSACVDHINGNPADNRAANLREISKAGNNQNIRRANAKSRHGTLGFTPNGRSWKALVSVNGKQKYLGTFATPEAAQEAYLHAKRQLHQGCTL